MSGNSAEDLRLALRRAGFPAIGVTMVDPSDWQTWSVQYVPPLTAEQQLAVAAFLQTYDYVAEAEASDDREGEARLRTDRLMGAIVAWVAPRVGVPVDQARAQILRLARRPRA